MKPFLGSICTSFFLVVAAQIPAGECSAGIETVAGRSGLGDGGPAVDALLREPAAVLFDREGNLYISDTFHHRIRKVAPNGMVSTVAGTGNPGWGGDGGPAIYGSLSYPSALAIDPAGNLYVVEPFAQRIRKVSADGKLTTLAGTGQFGFEGDGGPALKARFNGPDGIAADREGNVYVSDSYNHRIRRIDPDGRITTIAGTGDGGYGGDGGPATAAMLNYPGALAVDNAGNLFVADTLNQRVRRIDRSGIIETVVGNGSFGYPRNGELALEAAIPYVKGLAFDGAGNLYLSFPSDGRIRMVNRDGQMWTLAGDGSFGFNGDGMLPLATQLALPGGIAVDRMGSLYVADRLNDRVRKIVPYRSVTTVAGRGAAGFAGDGGPAAEAKLSSPEALALGPDGTLHVSDRDNHRLRAILPDGKIQTEAGNGQMFPRMETAPARLAPLAYPTGLVVDARGNALIASRLYHAIFQLTPTGSLLQIAGNSSLPFYAGDGGDARQASFAAPLGMTMDREGNLYVADSMNHAVRRITPAGIISTVAGTGEAGFSGDNGPATAARLSHPSSVAVDRHGNLYVADTYNSVIRRIDPTGTISTVLGGGFLPWPLGVPGGRTQLAFPRGVAVDPENNLYVSDTGHHRVLRMTTEGMITLVAGGQSGLSGGDGGDGDSAVGSLLHGPAGLAWGPSGVLYVADQGNHRVRRIDLRCEPAPAAIVRDASSGLQLWLASGSGAISIPGAYSDDVSMAADPWGRLVFAARESAGALRVGVLAPAEMRVLGSTRSEGDWAGSPAIGIGRTLSGQVLALVSGRTASGAYRLLKFDVRRNETQSAEDLGGPFQSDPAVAGCGDGSVYVVGRDFSGLLWSRRWLPDGRWEDWVRGPAGIAGQPAVACGGDQALLVAARNQRGHLVWCHLTGNRWTEPELLPGAGEGEARLAAGYQVVWLSILSPEGVLRWAPYPLAMMKWGDWQEADRKLRLAAPAIRGGGLEIFVVDEVGQMWLFTPGMQRWTRLGQAGEVRGHLASAPK
ncbi:MAG: SMP-30/gluconolactonase/LRE family protein [Bryobacteraceae bacterium]